MQDDYDAMAEALGVTRCRGIESTRRYCPQDHGGPGTVTNDGVVHFSHRPYGPTRRADTLAFLKLVARSQEPNLDEDVPWRRIYRLNMKVRFLARFLRIPDPARPARQDRAFVRASVASLPNSEPLRKQAYDWARRGPKRNEA